jgi:hypothetical protein
MSSERGAKFDLRIAQGKTFNLTLRAAARPYIYKAITAITRAAPARLTVPAHGIPDGWPVAVVSVKGMRQINAANSPPSGCDFTQAGVIDADTIELNAVNSSDFSAYLSGGAVQTYTPADLSGAVVRLTIKDQIGGAELLALDSALLGGIVLNNTTKTIVVTIDATTTAALAWTDGVYDAELEFATGVVVPLAYGRVSVEQEVTT